MQFRKDINGLRAIAVIAVVLFHFKPNWMPGGFVGVDIFFVISGFLMTGIIFRGIQNNTFSILNFYIARANRIFPALAVLCFILLVFGWFYLTPLDYETLGEHIAGSMGFVSNIVYWKESGYFDSVSHKKWLLHTWSLSVEWQFYIIYPLIIVTIRKLFSIRTIKYVIVSGTVIAFVFCKISTYKWPDPAYYLLPTRAWEMMLGGIAYLFPFKLKLTTRKLFEAVGLMIIIGSYLFITKDTPWPGYVALVPALGAFLLIQANITNSLVTGNIAFQKLGSWSYSIYIWHWPLVVAIHYFTLPEPWLYAGIFASILLGFISNKYVERAKFKAGFNTISSCITCKPIYFSAAIILLGGAVSVSSGAKDRFNILHIEDKLVMPLRNNGYCFYSANDDNNFKISKSIGTNCYLGDTTKKSSTLLFGDSYAGHNEPFFDVVFKANGSSFQSIVTNWCAPSANTSFTGPKTSPAYQQCILNREYLIEHMHDYKNIIFAGSWGLIKKKGLMKDTKEVIIKASDLGINVFIVATPFHYKNNPLDEFYKSFYFEKPFEQEELAGNDRMDSLANDELKHFAKSTDNVTFIERKSLYSRNNMFKINNTLVPYSLDGAHISTLGSIYSAYYFMKRPEYSQIMKSFNF